MAGRGAADIKIGNSPSNAIIIRAMSLSDSAFTSCLAGFGTASMNIGHRHSVVAATISDYGHYE